MRFLTRLVRTIEQLERVSQKCGDEDLRSLVADLYRQLTVVVNILEKIYSVYSELDLLIKTDLRLEPGLYIEAPQQPEKLSEYLERLKKEGYDPNKVISYLLGTDVAQIELRNGEIYIKPKV
ncbi:conserved hypothetical protein [Pyrobaculum islandicum DSM 4184]|uniref:Uncharacterized protein n=1 Tax=Pyrobaculum islandicum (strain DSM 4184 / JCM 9189 / GEO3) TaxID=384616 RepID=A1RT25_PYRIL|nr:hypothetical protein [Pyrobaculum islandicum]ABL88107.1 conserved hypothetical protein [Pyrobaculum islandicum DSM 4184]